MPEFQPYREELRAHFLTAYPEGRTRLGLMLLGALYHDTGKPETLTQDSSEAVHYYGHAEVSREHMLRLARTLGLSKREGELLACLVVNHMRIHQLANTGQPVSDRAIYRFFRDTGDVGLDLCLLSMADLQATYESTLSAEKLESELEVITRLMEAWFNRSQKVVSPPKLLDGNDIMRLFDLQPGPIFSQILAALVEAQAAGEVIDTRECYPVCGRIHQDTPSGLVSKQRVDRFRKIVSQSKTHARIVHNRLAFTIVGWFRIKSIYIR